MVSPRKISTNLVSSIYVIAVGKYRSKVALALSSNIVMVIVVLCASIKGNTLRGTTRKVITIQL